MSIRIALCFALLAGCVVDEDLSETDQAIESSNKLATNKLATNSLAANKLAANKLATASVAVGTTASQLINTADGREVLSYIIGCGLTAAQSVTLKDSANASWTFAGSIGLAGSWLTRGLTLDEQRWVSACVFARTNYFGVTVQLSMRGNTVNLATTTAERTAYPGLDGGFYGNLFDATGPKEYACDGTYNNPQRICSNQGSGSASATTMCGFIYTGTCAAACSGTYSGAIVNSSCRIANTSSSPPNAFPEAIMVFLQ